jgi:hypothetical protein
MKKRQPCCHGVFSVSGELAIVHVLDVMVSVLMLAFLLLLDSLLLLQCPMLLPVPATVLAFRLLLLACK